MPRIDPQDVSLIPATPADLPVLLEYMKGLRADDPMPAATLASDADSAAVMGQLLADESLGHVWLIRAAETVVGYAVLTYVLSLELGGQCGFVDEFYVAPQARGRGVGRRAMQLVNEEAQRLGLRALLLEVSPENERACGLYRSAGFVERKYRLMIKRIQSSDYTRCGDT